MSAAENAQIGRGVFVTGTDTGCGKTEVSLGMMRWLQARGLEVVGMKPVASGAESTPEGLRNADALRLQRQSSRPPPYGRVNPYAFAPPVAPHLAARQAGVSIDLALIRSVWLSLAARADLVLVEGVGGWRVPLGPESELADLVRVLRLPVVLVVGLRLGCLNHALLSAESIVSSGARLLGWVANVTDGSMGLAQENIAALEERLPAPCLGRVPRLRPPGPVAVAASLDLEAVMSPAGRTPGFAVG
jgi:dethiobiotin synthetase